ncbi:MAG: addiction module protein [Sulfuritalea sp.]|nr:addiction module protein [Sulfuritalea sp.]
MNARVEALIEQARGMTAEERVAALDALQELVVPPDEAWAEAWARESEDRLDAYQRGEIEAEDFDVVMERMRKDYLVK